MIDQQFSFFSKEIIEEFEKQNNVRIDLFRAATIDDIKKTFMEKKNNLSLVKIPFGKCWPLVAKGNILPINTFLSKLELEAFETDYILTRFGKKDGKQYFLPRKYETRVMVYRKSKVADALNVWTTHRSAINDKLKKINGYGLPYNYVLEEEPSKWDFFDIFVLGSIWSTTKYNGEKKPRIAHRGHKYLGTALRIIDRVLQCKGDLRSVLYLKHNSVVDAFYWEAAYAYAGIYNKSMWEEEWKGEDIWKGFASEDVFLSFLTQLDCTFLYGTGQDGLDGYIKNQEDLDIALMPSGCSLQLDQNGNILRKGTQAITNGGWLWGIPKKCPDPLLAFKLFTFISNKENQLQECKRFGMIPVRNDILKNKSIVFESGWISKMFRVSYRQVQINGENFVSSHAKFNSIADLYLAAWFDIVVSQNWHSEKKAPDRDYIKDLLHKEYYALALKVLGK
jgi:ABC-type glycerol-3-phosphate transport system substrate-binding protein